MTKIIKPFSNSYPMHHAVLMLFFFTFKGHKAKHYHVAKVTLHTKHWPTQQHLKPPTETPHCVERTADWATGAMFDVTLLLKKTHCCQSYWNSMFIPVFAAAFKIETQQLFTSDCKWRVRQCSVRGRRKGVQRIQQKRRYTPFWCHRRGCIFFF